MWTLVLLHHPFSFLELFLSKREAYETLSCIVNFPCQPVQVTPAAKEEVAECHLIAFFKICNVMRNLF